MLEFIVRDISVTLEIPLRRQPFDLAKIHALSEVVFGAVEAESFSLPTSAATLTTTDVLYRYTSEFSLFKGLGVVRLSGSELFIEFKNLSTIDELAVVSRISTAICATITDRTSDGAELIFTGHSEGTNPTEGETYFKNLAMPGFDLGSHRMISLASREPEHLRKITLEKSHAYPGGLFFYAEITNMNSLGDFVSSLAVLQKKLHVFGVAVNVNGPNNES